MMENTQRKSIVGPLILIALGFVFLLHNLEIIDWGIWETIRRFWPIVLIAAGLEIILRRAVSWGPLILAAAVVGVAFIVGIAPITCWTYEFPGREPLADQTFAEAIGAAKNARVEIDTDIADLRLYSPAAAGNLVDGSASNAARVAKEARIEGETAYFTLTSRGARFGPFRANRRAAKTLRVNLTESIPLQLKVNTGIGASTLELSRIKATRIEVRTGIGRTSLTLPRSGRVEAYLEGGIGETIVTIPKGMAASIRVEKGIGAIEVKGDFLRTEQGYETNGFEAAENRVYLKIEGGIGKITIREESWL